MEGKEELRFKVNLSEEGASKLSRRLTLALKDYMGDYVDDTLVKYVIVLLGNGRSKEEVKEDLDVFLGDSSDSFVTWLWDHLASDLDQYIQPPVSFTNEAAQAISDLVELNGEVDSQKLVSDSGKGTLKPSRNRHNRDWKGLMSVENDPPLCTPVTSDTQKEEIVHRKVVHTRRSASPLHPVNRKRSRADDLSRSKRKVSQTTIAAPRRLLQFAVRDAVATTRSSNLPSEPARKRLRSVVSTPTNNFSEEVPSQKIHPVARVPNPVTTAIRAVAEAAKDVKRGKSGNVFDRLSHGVDVRSDLVSAIKTPAIHGAEYEDYDGIRGNSHETYVQTREYSRKCNVHSSLIGSNTGLASDSASDNVGYGNFSGHRVMNVSETGASRDNKADDSLMVQYSVAQKSDEVARRPRKKGQEPLVSAGSAKHKIVNISVNVNTWKPQHYQPTSEIVEAGSLELHPDDTRPTNFIARPKKDYNNQVTVIENGKPDVVSPKDAQKTVSGPGANSTGRPPEDAESRTIFVNNIHFAATKDTLSRHFNKFGEVLKVMILTDAATGHPKGSAYVEFMRKEAAENALTLDGTSFMSRIIKVVKKSSAQLEANPVMSWPRNTRGARYSQAPFPRVFPGAFRGRPAMKLGVRSMQWKRDNQQIAGESDAAVSNTNTNTNTNTPSAGRGFTYVRAVPKTDENAPEA